MIAFDKDTLPNGLTLLHHNDPTTPFVVVNLLYRVGAKNEDPERTGFAHLFEHLMFEGTANVPDFDQPLQKAGGINNAFTNNDYTNYYIKLPKENIKLALFLEADRMQHLDISEENLNTQKKVVIEEFKENYTNMPYGDVWHILRRLVYKKHPYRWPTIGKDFHHIQDAGLNEVVSFYRHYYNPSNAILCVAGNISKKEAFDLSSRYLGRVKDKGGFNGQAYSEPAQLKARRKTVRRDVPLDAIYIAFKMPGRLSDEYYQADLLSDILADGKSSRFRERLVKQQQKFVSADAYITGTNETGMFVVEGKLREGVAVEDAEAALWRELEDFSAHGPGENELEKVRNKTITSMNFSENNLLSRAIGLCYHEMLGDAGLVNREEAEYMAVDKKGVMGFAQKFLSVGRSSTLLYLKK